jgi:hypothetical protein
MLKQQALSLLEPSFHIEIGVVAPKTNQKQNKKQKEEDKRVRTFRHSFYATYVHV